jgi:ferredoxin
VNYRDYRAEQRTSAKKATELRLQGKPAGDCVGCGLYVAVCPIEIDIREAPNFACINPASASSLRWRDVEARPPPRLDRL